MASPSTHDEPPTKRPRLLAPPSPALSQTSDMPFDDVDDDLYDSPGKPLTTQTSPKASSNAIHSQSPQTASAGPLPGLQLLPATEQRLEPSHRIAEENSSDNEEYDPDGEDFYEDAQTPKPHDNPPRTPQLFEEPTNGVPNPPIESNSPKLGESGSEEQQTKAGAERNASALPSANGDREEATSSIGVNPAAETHDANGEIFIATAKANRGDPNAEFEYDSSADDASDSSLASSESSSSDEDDSDGEEYELLDPREQARILMQEDGGSDDEGTDRVARPQQPRTANEQPERHVEKPNIEVSPEMEIVELGVAEAIVEDMNLASLIIRGRTSGDVRVLDSGSVLCLENRAVLGAISETLGRVKEPRYSVTFNNKAEIADVGIDIGTKVFYVVEHSEYVFTQPLKMLKGSDASNQHDEEVGVAEVEFSDDEAEAEYKRNIRQAKKAGKMAGAMSEQSSAFSKASTDFRHGQQQEYPHAPINYDDDEGSEDLYTPLTRPSNLIGHPIPPKPQFLRGNLDRGRGSRQRGDRSDRGGRGGFAGRGGGREHRGGNFQHNRGHKQHGSPRFRSGSPVDSHSSQGQMPRQSPPYQQNSSQRPARSPSLPQPPAQVMSGQTGGYYPTPSQPTPHWNHAGPPVSAHTAPAFWNHINPPVSAHTATAHWNHAAPPVSAHVGGFPPVPMPYSPQTPYPGALTPGAHINPAFFRSQSPPFSPPPPPPEPTYHQPNYNGSYQHHGAQVNQSTVHYPSQNIPNYSNTYGTQMRGSVPPPPPSNQGYDPSRPWMA